LQTEAYVRQLLAVLAAIGLAAASVAAQAGGEWKVPRTPDGRPDLQGVWSNNSVTPMTRPAQWRDKERLTDAEVEELKSLVARSVDQGGDAVFGSLVQIALDLKDSKKFDQISYDATTGNYNQFWMVDRDWDNRTSLITNPANGQFPALTAAGTERRAREAAERQKERERRQRAEGPESLPLTERCVSYGAPRTGTGYNSYMQITQSPQAVVILQEMIHDARVVPLDGKPHLPANVRQLHGDPRGRWDGDTLVVETTNFVDGFQGSTADVRLIERYTRASPDFLNWEITVDDPATWVQPWTFMIRLKKTDDEVYEYACHEGNYSMPGILAGARRDEAKAAAAAKGSR
jgi:hypothetical protein